MPVLFLLGLILSSKLATARPSSPVYIYSTNYFCIGDSITLGSTPAQHVTYQWKIKEIHFSSTHANPKVLLPGSMWVHLTYKDTLTGTVVKDSLFMNGYQKPKPLIEGTFGGCVHQKLAFQTFPKLGNSYSWSTADGVVVSRSNTNYIEIVFPYSGSKTISVTETTPSGCSKTTKQTIEIYSLPSLTVQQQAYTLCGLDSFRLNPQVAATVKIKWYYKGALIHTGKTIAFYDAVPSANLIMEAVDTVTTCSVRDTARLVFTPIPKNVTITGPAQACVSSNSNYSTPAEEGFTYTWVVNGGTILLGQGTSLIKVRWKANAGAYSVSLTKTYSKVGGIACDYTVVKPVTVSSALHFQVDKNYNTCPGVSIPLGPAVSPPSVKIEWYNSAGLQIGTGTPLNYAFYENSKVVLVSEYSPYGCKRYDTVNVSVPSTPEVVIEGNVQVCTGLPETYYYALPAGASFQSIKVNNGKLITQGATYASIQWNKPTEASFTLFYLASSGCLFSKTLEVQPLALDVPVISGDDRPVYWQMGKIDKDARTYRYEIPKQKNVTYRWLVQGGSIVSDPISHEVEVLWQHGAANTTGKLKVVRQSLSLCNLIDTVEFEVAIGARLQFEYDNLLSGLDLACTGNSFGVKWINAMAFDSILVNEVYGGPMQIVYSDDQNSLLLTPMSSHEGEHFILAGCYRDGYEESVVRIELPNRYLPQLQPSMKWEWMSKNSIAITLSEADSALQHVLKQSAIKWELNGNSMNYADPTVCKVYNFQEGDSLHGTVDITPASGLCKSYEQVSITYPDLTPIPYIYVGRRCWDAKQTLELENPDVKHFTIYYAIPGVEHGLNNHSHYGIKLDADRPTVQVPLRVFKQAGEYRIWIYYFRQVASSTGMQTILWDSTYTTLSLYPTSAQDAKFSLRQEGAVVDVNLENEDIALHQYTVSGTGGLVSSYTIPNFKHEFTSPGSYKISLVTQSNGGCIESYDSTVEIPESLFSEANPLQGSILFPNPSSGHNLWLKSMNAMAAQNIQATVYSMQGSIMASFNVEIPTWVPSPAIIDVSAYINKAGLPAGMYSLTLVDHSGRPVHLPFVVVR